MLQHTVLTHNLQRGLRTKSITSQNKDSAEGLLKATCTTHLRGPGEPEKPGFWEGGADLPWEILYGLLSHICPNQKGSPEKG